MRMHGRESLHFSRRERRSSRDLLMAGLRSDALQQSEMRRALSARHAFGTVSFSEEAHMKDYPFPWKFEGYRYDDLYLMQQVTEAQVQKEIIDLLALYRVDAVAIDAGGRRQRGRMMGAAKAAGINLGGVQNVKTGAAIPAGFSDLEATFAPAGRACYIEVKAPAWIDTEKRVIRRAGQPSAEQLEFLLSKHQRGAAVLVAWSSKDVEEALTDLLKENRRSLG
jgi:hypothetical protein